MKKNIMLGTILISALLSLSYNTYAAEVQVLAKATKSWNGQALPAYSKGTPEITILRIQVAPKEKLPMHTHPVINAGFLIKGQLNVITKKGKVLELRAGDSLVEVVDTWHYGENPGDEPADIVVFYAGVKGKPVTVK